MKDTNPLKGKLIIGCHENTSLDGNPRFYVMINCRDQEELFKIQDYLVKVRDEKR